MIALGYLFSILYASVCLGIGFGIYKLGVPKVYTRKIVHILVGFEWMILYHFFGVSVHFLIVCLLFLAILTISHRKKLLPMIESDGENSPGTVYYALAMSVMSLVTILLPDMIIPFGIGVFCTSLGDGFAGLIGYEPYPRGSVNFKIYGNKTFFGSLFNFLVCLSVVAIVDARFNLGLETWHILSLAVFATELELFSERGLDNITVTLGVSFLAYFMLHFDVKGYILPILLTPMIIAFSYKKKALTVSGIIAALVLDMIISISLGNEGFVVLLTFFVGGIIVDKIKKHYKKSEQNEKTVEKRGSCRDHVQVGANGSVAAICALGYMLVGHESLLLAFAASLAEALADTAASGIGIIGGKAYDPFRRKSCTPGISGGMSALGSLASVVGASIVSILSLILGLVDVYGAVIVAISATLGAFLDSLLGSLAQVKYICCTCGDLTEREEHCGIRTERHSGLFFVTNDMVNFLGTLFSALLSLLLYNYM